jgi:hypothetical protein
MTQLTPLNGWTSEQITRLAPDAGAAQDARKLSQPGKWASLGRDALVAWGQFQGSGGNPYQVKANLERLAAGEAALHCTCPSRKQPCKHALGLLLILVEQPNSVQAVTMPPWVQQWLDKQAEKAKRDLTRKQAKTNNPPDPAQQAKAEAARRQKIAAGIDDLEQWLINVMRGGLSDPQLRQYSTWDGKAARLVDAQAGGLAAWLRGLSGMPSKGDEHQAALLKELGRLYLLTQAYKRFESLTPETQADLRTVIGWQPRKEDLPNPLTVFDQWLVIGRYDEVTEDKLRMQRLWLYGAGQRRHALILEYAFNSANFETNVFPGTWLEAEVAFFPSRAPLRAFVPGAFRTPLSIPSLACPTLRENINAYSAALAANPWLLHYPFLVEATVTRQGGRFVLRDADGLTLPIGERLAADAHAANTTHTANAAHWSLFAVGGHAPIRVMGEWDGAMLWPLSVLLPDRVIDLNGMRRPS